MNRKVDIETETALTADLSDKDILGHLAAPNCVWSVTAATEIDQVNGVMVLICSEADSSLSI